jgi:hypothetical protein
MALRTRWLWLQRTDPDRAWASLPMKIELDIQQLFEASIAWGMEHKLSSGLITGSMGRHRRSGPHVDLAR